jgi:hypothetical protein
LNLGYNVYSISGRAVGVQGFAGSSAALDQHITVSVKGDTVPLVSTEPLDDPLNTVFAVDHPALSVQVNDHGPIVMVSFAF